MRPSEPVSDLDWSADRAREFGGRLLDLWTELLAELPSLPVSRRHRRDTVADAVGIDIPDQPLPDEALLEHLRTLALGQATYPGHPRFMAYITGAGTVPGAAAALLAAGLNQNTGAWRLAPGATEVELRLVGWLAARLGMPVGSGGLLTSGGAMATLLALKAARDRAAGASLRSRGLTAADRLVLYASDEAHIVVDRAADILGLGTDAVRHLETDGDYRLRIPALRAAIGGDRAAGLMPFAVVGTAGTVATGSIDPLDEIAGVCDAEHLWFHVDAAYGGPAALVDELRPLLAGIEAADSIALDAHKWLYAPLTAGVLLVRDPALLRDSFAVEPSYQHEDRQLTGRGDDLRTMGAQFSRGFDALKVWVSLLAHGRAAYARRVAHDVELARYLAAEAERRPGLEPMAPTTLSIACFRYVPPGLGGGPGRDQYLDRLNARLLTEVQLDGRAWCSNALLRGRFCLRACIVNFRTEADDVDALLDVAVELGARLDGEMRPGTA